MIAYPLLFEPSPRKPYSLGEGDLLDRLELLCRQNSPLSDLNGLSLTIRKLLEDPAFGPGDYYLKAYAGQLNVLRRNYPNNLLVASIELDSDAAVELRRPLPPYPFYPTRDTPP